MIYGWLIDWVNDSTVDQLTGFYCWFIDGLTDSLVTGSPFDQIIVFTGSPRTDQLTEQFDWLTEYLTLLSRDWPSHGMMYIYLPLYGWLIDWLADSTVRGLTNWLNDLWLVYWLTNWLYCLKTDQHTEWWNLVDWLNKWLHCPRTDHQSKWFMDGWLTIWL